MPCCSTMAAMPRAFMVADLVGSLPALPTAARSGRTSTSPTVHSSGGLHAPLDVLLATGRDERLSGPRSRSAWPMLWVRMA